jgi:hypothetical protein
MRRDRLWKPGGSGCTGHSQNDSQWVVILEITFLNPILAWMNVASATFTASVISVAAPGSANRG